MSESSSIFSFLEVLLFSVIYSLKNVFFKRQMQLGECLPDLSPHILLLLLLLLLFYKWNSPLNAILFRQNCY